MSGDGAGLSRDTRFGISLAADTGLAAELARRAETAGFDDAWTSEFAHRSATIPLAAMAGSTSRVGLGSAILYGFGRSPLVLAGEAADIDRLSNGRLILGLGSAQPARMRHWLGIDPAHPAARMEELVGLLRELWTLHEGPVEHEGRFYAIRVSPFGAVEPPVRRSVPIYVAGVNRRMVRVAGAVADGLVGHPIMTPSAFDEFVRPVFDEAATARADRPRTVGMVITCIADDDALARREAAAQIAFYSSNTTYNFIFDFHHFTAAVAEIREAIETKDWARAIAAVPPEMVDEMALAGTAGVVRERAERYLSRYDHLIFHSPSMVASPPPGSGFRPQRYRENLDAILSTFGRQADQHRREREPPAAST